MGAFPDTDAEDSVIDTNRFRDAHACNLEKTARSFGLRKKPLLKQNGHKKGATASMANIHSSYKVYVLSGASNAGKTTTLNHLAELVSKIRDAEMLDGPHPIDSVPAEQRGDNQYCFRVLVNGEPQVVGISTWGDTADVISDGFAYFDRCNCNISFVASKIYGCSVRAVEAEAGSRGIIPRYCYLINERNHRNQTEIELATASFLCSFVTNPTR